MCLYIKNKLYSRKSVIFKKLLINESYLYGEPFFYPKTITIGGRISKFYELGETYISANPTKKICGDIIEDEIIHGWKINFNETKFNALFKGIPVVNGTNWELGFRRAKCIAIFHRGMTSLCIEDANDILKEDIFYRNVTPSPYINLYTRKRGELRFVRSIYKSELRNYLTKRGLIK